MKTKTIKTLIVLSSIVLVGGLCENIAPESHTINSDDVLAYEYPDVIGLIEDTPAEGLVGETPVDLFDKYFGSEANIARAIAQAESGMRADVVSRKNRNGTQDRGIMQINSCHADKVGGDLASLLDPETNIRIAKQIRDSWEGFNAWTTFNSKAYLAYLK